MKNKDKLKDYYSVEDITDLLLNDELVFVRTSKNYGRKMFEKEKQKKIVMGARGVGKTSRLRQEFGEVIPSEEELK